MVITSWLSAFGKLFGKKKTSRTRNQQTKIAHQTTQSAEDLENRTLLTVNAVLDIYTGINEDNPFQVLSPGVLSNDPAGLGTRSAIQVANTPVGTAVLQSNGSFLYTPGISMQTLNHNELSIQEFTYKVQDSGDGTIGTEAIVRLSVLGLNDQVTALNTNQTHGFTEDGLPVALGAITVDDLDFEDQLTATLTLSDAAAGTLSAPGASFNAGVLTVTGTEAEVNAALAAVTFTQAADYDKNFTIGVDIRDGLEDGMVAVTDTITMTATPVADNPRAQDSSFTINEDSGLHSDTLIGSDPDTNPVLATLTFSLTGTAASKGTVNITDAATGAYTYTPFANEFGTDTFQFEIEDDTGLFSTVQTVTVTINAVNDVPSFLPATDEQFDEDTGAHTRSGWAAFMSPGPANEASQILHFNVTSDNPDLFSVAPAIDATTGDLTYTFAANRFGTAVVTVTLQDDGGTLLGGVDTTVPITFNIIANPINDAPSFIAGLDQTVDEDALPQFISGWASSISAGPFETQNLTFNVTGNTNPGLFAVGPVVLSDGTLFYTLNPDANGFSDITVELEDDGGTAGGGIDTSAGQTFRITVDAVNDAPSFNQGLDDTTLEDSGLNGVAGWATSILPGPATATDEAGQILTFNITNNTNPGLFSIAPTINSANGNLFYTLAPNAFGSADITITLSDDGGTLNGGADTSIAHTFNITVTGVNDAPSFDVGLDQTVDEDALAQTVLGWAGNISAGPGETQALTFNVTGNTTPGLFSVAPAISADGTLTYTLAPNANGSSTITITLSDDGGTANGGLDTSASQQFTITADAVNDAPSFTDGGNVTVLEDSGAANIVGFATNILPGPLTATDEASQVLTFNLTGNTNAALFQVLPAIDPITGNLTFTPAANAFGTTTVTFTLSDNGGTGNSGVDTSVPHTFDITITGVNDAPSFNFGANQSLLEDSPAQEVVGWASGMSAGPGETQTLTFNVTGNTNPGLFSVAPAIDATTGTLTYTLAPDANGSANVTITLSDNGGTANSGVDTTSGQVLVFTVTAVNDAPSFTAGADQEVLEDSGPHTVLSWATNIDKGAANEGTDILTFNLTNNTNPALFAVAPAIDPLTGDLTYILADNAYGEADITFTLSDDGGIANSGDDTSDPQTFKITVTTVNDAPNFIVGSNQTVDEDAGSTTTNVINNGSFENGLLDGWSHGGIDTDDPAGNDFYPQMGTLSPFSGATVQAPPDGVLAAMADMDGPGASYLYQDFAVPSEIVSAGLSFELYLLNQAFDFFNPGDLDPFNDPNQQFRVDIISSTADPFSTDAEDVLYSVFQTEWCDASEFGYTTVSEDLTSFLAGHEGETLRLRFATVNTEFYFQVGIDDVQLNVTTAAANTVAGFAGSITAGPNETQNLTFEVTNDNNGLFSVQPAIDPVTGDLTYTLAPNANGSATVSVVLKDDGGTDNGGSDSSGTQQFTITVDPVNDAPVFTKDLYDEVKEDAGAQTVIEFAYNIAGGPATAQDEATQLLSFEVTNDNNALFTVQPTIDPLTGTLTYTLADDAHGYANVYVQLSDDGGTDNGGVDESDVQMFTIIVKSVNDAPSFALPALPDQTILEDAGPQSVLAFATGMSAGPANESTQDLWFDICTSDDGAFTTYPFIDETTGDLTYEVAPNANGDITVWVTLVDNGGIDNCGEDESPTVSFVIHVTPVNDAPDAQDDSITTDEDIPVSINVLSNDSDVDGDPMEIFVNAPSHGIVSVNDNGTPGDYTDDYVDYTPHANYHGTDSFTYLVSDHNGGSDMATVNITINPVNDDPTTSDGAESVNEDGFYNSGLSAGDVDLDTLTYSIVDGPSHGVISNFDSGTGAYTYTPTGNYNGPDSFTFKVNDGTVDSNVSTISITVNPVDDATIAVDGTNTTAEDTPVSGTLSSIEVDGDTLTYAISVQPTHGTITSFNPATGEYTYSPDANYNGPDLFKFTVNDGVSDSNEATVTLTITAVNDAPVADAGSFNTDEDTPYSGFVTGDDVDGDTITFAVVSGPASGQLDFNPTTGAFTYTPAANYNGGDSFSFLANDGNVDGDSAIVTITINPVNDTPVANGTSFSTNEDTPLSNSVTGSDIDGDNLTYHVSDDVDHGVLVLNSDGSFTYTPAGNYHGDDTFTFFVNDGTINSAAATVTISVQPVNDAPTAVSGSVDATEDTPSSGNLIGSDIDGDTITYIIVDQPLHGSVTVDPNTGAATYTPHDNYNGPDSFTFKVNDGSLDSNIATMTVTVDPVNDDPIASSSSANVSEDGTLSSSVTASDIDGDNLTYSLVSDVTHGDLTFNSDGTYTYTPDENYNGPDSFTFLVNDGTVNSNTATISITVLPVNDAPVAEDDADATTAEDTPVSGTLEASDIDGDDLTYSIVDQPAHGSVSLNPTTGEVTYTPAADYFGTDSFTFKVNDGTVDSNTATVTVTISPVNDAPVASNGTLSVAEDGTGNGNLSATDVDSGSLTYTIVDQPLHGDLDLNPATGAYTYTPDADYHGSDSFTFKVNDGSLDSGTATVSITVTPVNDTPTTTGGSISTNEDTPATGNLNASDIDGDDLTFSVTQPAHGLVEVNPATGAYTYTPDDDYNGSDSFTFTVNDGTVNSTSATINITVNPTNDAPVANDATFGVAENSANGTVVGTATASDVDTGDTKTFAITDGNTGGTFAINSTTGAITVANNTLLNFETNPTFTLTVTVEDANGLTDTSTITINLTNADDPLVLRLPTPAPQFVAKTGPIIIDSSANAFDEDTPNLSYSGGSLTVQITGGAGTKDRLSIHDAGAGEGHVDTKGGGKKLFYNGTQFATVTGIKSTNMVITFLTGASEAAVNALLKQITFDIKGTPASTATRTLTYSLKNSAASPAVTATKQISVAQSIAARSVTLSSGVVNYSNGATPVAIDPAATVTGPSNVSFNGGRLTVTITSGVNSNNRLRIANVGGITLAGTKVLYNGQEIGTATIGNNTLSVKFGASASPAAAQALARAITFGTTTANTNLLNRVISFKFTEVTGLSSAATTRQIHFV